MIVSPLIVIGMRIDWESVVATITGETDTEGGTDADSVLLFKNPPSLILSLFSLSLLLRIPP